MRKTGGPLTQSTTQHPVCSTRKHIAFAGLVPITAEPVEWAPMTGRETCAICQRGVTRGEGYVVRIDLMADPRMPELSGEDLGEIDLNSAIRAAIEEANKLTAEDLQDGVHRRFEYRLCAVCHRRVLANPLGLPRDHRIGEN